MAEFNLANLKASGIYTIEIDGSVTQSFPTVFGRLVIGSSRKGLMNSVIEINDQKVSDTIYGTIDSFLENRGSYFHRAINIMLGEGPVYALNVIPVDMSDDTTNVDNANFVTINTESASESASPSSSGIKNFFNRQKFWAASDTELNNVKNLKYSGALANKLLSFANLGKKPVTIFVQKASINGYDVTAKEWYTSLGPNVKIPNVLNDNDLISDFLVDVIIIEGTWTNYKTLSADPVYYKYFNQDGLLINKMDEFLSLSTVNVVTRAQGSIVPDFQDRAGNTIAIDEVLNVKFPFTEMLCAIDNSKAEEINLIPDTYVGFDDTIMATQRIDIVGHGIEDLANPIDDFNNKLIDVLSYTKAISNIFRYKNNVNSVPSDIEVDTISEPNVFVKAYSGSTLYEAWKLGLISTGDLCVDAYPVSTTKPSVYINIVPETSGSRVYIAIRATTAPGVGSTNMIIDSTNIAINNFTIVTYADCYKYAMDLTAFSSVNTTNNTVIIDASTASTSAVLSILEFVKPKNYIKVVVGATERTRMTKILTVSKKQSGLKGQPGYQEIYTITTMSSQFGIDTTGNILTLYKGVPNFVKELKGISLGEFKLRNSLLPDGSSSMQRAITQFMFDTGISSAIYDGEGLDIRHIVDTYNGDIGPSAKYNFAKLAASHGRAIAFVNDPSMSQLEKSIDPSFNDSFNGIVSMEYFSEGGNIQLNPQTLYTLPSDVTQFGVPIESYTGFCFPWFVVRENGKMVSVPPAPYWSNVYIRKFKSGNQYGIAAGKKGVFTESELSGLEYDLSDTDRAWLEPIGHNLAIKRRGIGIMAFSNNTAYQKVESAMNNMHVRDSLITIETDINAILFNFLYDFNDEITRIRVKSLLDNYLSDIKSAKGISSFTVQFDQFNNTDAVISQKAAIVDIKIDFPRGIHKFLNRITLTKVGGSISASATGFVPA
jgi:hypothetical protein